MSEVSLGGLLHLVEDHGRDFLREERLRLVLVLHLDLGPTVNLDDLRKRLND